MEHMNIRHILRNVIIAKFSYLGIAWVYRLVEKRHGPLTRIVVFHDVPDRTWFEAMLAVLVRETRVLTPEEFVAGIRDAERINTLITFDDGYASWIGVALPALERFSLKALFFINSGLLDAAPSPIETSEFMRESLHISPRKALSWEGAATLLEHGHAIGGHARHHQNLSKLDRKAVQDETLIDKLALESQLGITLTDFAYPFGTRKHFTEETIEAVRNVGYTRAYTAVSRFVRPQSETFEIPRMCIEDVLTPQELRVWLRGGYDLFDMVKKLCVG
jgi:peptidoglycan/xylan/chitin deacetylase (PgdA/CDA1 family)